MRIVALFRIDPTLIDQPSHELVAFWDNDPDLQKLARAVNVNFGTATDNVIVATVKLWQQKAARIQDVLFWLSWIESDSEMPSPPESISSL